MGCTLRHLAAKVAGSKVKVEMGVFLDRRQLGYGIKGGAEAAVHAARLFLGELNPDKAVLKLDFSNAFNSIRRVKMLGAVSEHILELYPFVHSAYSAPSSLFWGEKHYPVCRGDLAGRSLGATPFLPPHPSYVHATGVGVFSVLT